MRGPKAGPPGRPGDGSKVISIVDELERRRKARDRERASSMHLRELEANLELIDHTAALKDLQLDAEIERLGALTREGDASEARLQQAAIRATRALQRCLRGDPDAGLAEWAEIVAEVPGLAHTYLVRARWLMQSDPAAALADYDRAVAAEPRNATAYWRRADCHLALGDQDRALANYRRAVALDPSLFDAFHSIAKIAAARGEHADAVQAYDRAIHLAPRYVDFHLGRAQSLEQLEDFDGAARDYSRILELDPSRNDARFYRVIAAHRGGHLERAVDDMTRFVEIEGDDHHNHRILGKMRLEAGHHALAVASLTRALEITPDEPLTLVHRGRAHTELGDHASAFADLDRAVALKQDEPEIYLLHARAAATVDHVEVALASTSRAIELAPDHALAHVMRAVYRGHLAVADEAREAIMADLDRAVELEPHNLAFLRHRAEYQREYGSVAAALSDFERALAIAPQLAPLHFGRGYCKSRLDEERYDLDPDYEEDDAETRARCLSAVVDLERAIELGLCTEDLYSELWSAYGQIPDAQAEALQALDRGIEALPDLPLLHVFREGMRRSRGDLAGADQDHARALELGFRFASNGGEAPPAPLTPEAPSPG